MLLDTTGDLIKMLRKEHGLSQEELGQVIGLKKSAIQKIENGTIKNLKMDVLRRICIHFGVPPLFVLFPEYAKYFCTGSEVWDITTVRTCIELNDKARRRVKEYVMDLSAIEENRIKEPHALDQNKAIKKHLKLYGRQSAN